MPSYELTSSLSLAATLSPPTLRDTRQIYEIGARLNSALAVSVQFIGLHAQLFAALAFDSSLRGLAGTGSHYTLVDTTPIPSFLTQMQECEAIIERALDRLTVMVRGTAGTTGSDFRQAVGDLRAHALELLMAGGNGPLPDLYECFELARRNGATLGQLAGFRVAMLAEEPTSLAGTLMKQICVLYGLMTESLIISNTNFVCRDDVTATMSRMNAAFNIAEEMAADEMDQATFRSLIALHSKVIFHLTERGRPLPRMIRYEFDDGYPTLVMAHSLYADSTRADELRAENRVVHPLFAPRTGRALSA